MARREDDGKVQRLRDERCLNPRPVAVSDERFGDSEFFDPRDLVQVKYEMVRRARVQTPLVSQPLHLPIIFAARHRSSLHLLLGELCRDHRTEHSSGGPRHGAVGSEIPPNQANY